MGFFDFLGGVGQILGQIASLIAQIFQFLWTALIQVFTFLWNTLAAVANAVVGIFRTLGTFFQHLWHDYIHPAVTGILKIYERIRARLAAIFAPVLKWIARVQGWFMRHIYPIMFRIQNLLSRLRVVLAFFRILGFKWAAKLDADIQRIQGYVTLVMADVIRTLNTATSMLNLVLDPWQIIRRSFFTGTLFSNLGPLRRAMSFGADRATTPDEQKGIDETESAIYGSDGYVLTDPAGAWRLSPGAAASQKRVDDMATARGVANAIP